MIYQFRQAHCIKSFINMHSHLQFIQWKDSRKGYSKDDTSSWTFDINDLKNTFKLELIQ